MTRLFTRLAHRLAAEVRTRLGREPEWRKRKRKVDQQFDARFGVSTGGITHLKELDVPGASWRDGVDHIASDPGEFTAAIDALDVDLSGFTFIDLGSGKGRALLLASDYPFRQIIGVEFAEPLVQAARQNVEAIAESRDVSRISIVHADALEYDLPNEPSILFLYNPFGASVMEVVAERTRASLLARPRELIVLYLNPFQLETWRQVGFDLVEHGPHFAVLKLDIASAAAASNNQINPASGLLGSA